MRLAALLRALEGEMLEEVCGTIGLVSLCARAGIDPDSDSGGLRIWGVLGRDLGNVCQLYYLLTYFSGVNGSVR